MTNENGMHTINKIAELTGRDRRTLKRDLENVRPAMVANGRKLYRLSEVEDLLQSKTTLRNPSKPSKDSEQHWLHDLIRDTILLGGHIQDVMKRMQKMRPWLLSLAKSDPALNDLVEDDINTVSEVYGKPVAELLADGAIPGKKDRISEQLLDLWVQWHEIAQAMLDIDCTLNVTGFFTAQTGRILKAAALRNKAKKKRIRFPLGGEILRIFRPEGDSPDSQK